MSTKTRTAATESGRIGIAPGSRTGFGRFFWMANYAEGQESGFIWSALAGKIADCLRLLLPLYLSRRVLDSVFAGESFEDIFRNAVIVTASYFLLTVLSGYCQRKANFHYQRFMKKHQINKALTVLAMDYDETERDDTQNELVAIRQLELTAAMGIRSFQQNFSILFGNFICIAVGISMVWDLFFVPAATVSPLMNWGLNIGYLGMIFLLHYFAVRIDVATMRVYGDTAKNIYLKNHRYLRQYSELLFDYKVGKDIRLYCEPLGRHYNEVYRKRSSETYQVFFRLFSVSGAKRNLISGAISVLTAVFVGCRMLWGSVDPSDVFLCVGVLELLFRTVEELTEAFGKIISSDGVRKKFIRLLVDHELRDVADDSCAALVSASADDSRSASEGSSCGAPAESTEKRGVGIAAKMGEKEKEEEKEEEKERGGENDAGEPSEIPTVEFRQVAFQYPNSDIRVLKGVNLKLYGNQKLALVGVNGSGKTTLIKLLLGLYKPTEGRILICGEDTADWTSDRFVSYFSAVFQDFKLFSLTLGENVAAAEVFDGENVAQSLRKTGLSKFLERNGQDAYLYRDFEEGGIEISGGEAQKIAMARAIYHGGKCFILDEPTAALDPLSEYEIYTHFGEITSENPAIYISHRLSSCIFCDVVAVMDDGKIVQFGTHEELLADSGGIYAELWNAQAKHYKNASDSTDFTSSTLGD